MKKRMFTLMLALFLMVPMLAMTVRADCGPKPSTVITVHTGGGERCVVTLLAATEGWGPHTAVGLGDEPSEAVLRNKLQEEAWYAFRDHRDPDGYQFWGRVFEGNVAWGYYPPEDFKIAVYYPDYDILWVSEKSYERYSFHSDYRLNLPALGAGAQSGETDMVLHKASDVPQELVVLITECVVYLRCLRIDESRGRIVGYTVLANLASVMIGFLLLN